MLFDSPFAIDCREKSNIFNSFFIYLFFFTKQYTLVSNNSLLPSKFTYMTEECTQSITFSESDVIKIIRALDVNKAHDHDNISVRMTKLCINSVGYLLTLIFKNSMAACTFASQ